MITSLFFLLFSFFHISLFIVSTFLFLLIKTHLISISLWLFIAGGSVLLSVYMYSSASDTADCTGCVPHASISIILNLYVKRGKNNISVKCKLYQLIINACQLERTLLLFPARTPADSPANLPSLLHMMLWNSNSYSRISGCYIRQLGLVPSPEVVLLSVSVVTVTAVIAWLKHELQCKINIYKITLTNKLIS